MEPSIELISVVPSLEGAVPAAHFGGGRPRFRLDDGTLTALSARLEPAGSVATGLSGSARLLAAAPGLGTWLAEDGELAVVTPAGRTDLPVAAADAACLLADGLALVTAPDLDERGHLLLLVELGTPAGPARVVAEHLVRDALDASAHVLAHPSARAAVVDLPMGQDGSFVLRVDVTAGPGLAVAELCPGEDVVGADISPDGEQILLTPYPSDPETARVLRWTDLSETGRLSAVHAGLPIGIDMSGTFLGDDHLLLVDIERGLLLATRDLTASRPLTLPDLDLSDDDTDIEWVCALGDRTFAVGAWYAGGGRRTLVHRITLGR